MVPHDLPAKTGAAEAEEGRCPGRPRPPPRQGRGGGSEGKGLGSYS
ncbi:hypothetical protein BF49_7323 [Bradyrhizobium sp.]|nr:hypothetical protein BF49_7323 [Bradyrhizobium sp.]